MLLRNNPNIDDHGTVMVNGTVLFEAMLGQDTGRVEINSALQPGLNTILFTLENTAGVYAYGFDVYHNGRLHLRARCGLVGSFGCNDGDETVGTVFEQDFWIRQ